MDGATGVPIAQGRYLESHTERSPILERGNTWPAVGAAYGQKAFAAAITGSEATLGSTWGDVGMLTTHGRSGYRATMHAARLDSKHDRRRTPLSMDTPDGGNFDSGTAHRRRQ